LIDVGDGISEASADNAYWKLGHDSLSVNFTVSASTTSMLLTRAM
jgi:hypothetical protein